MQVKGDERLFSSLLFDNLTDQYRKSATAFAIADDHLRIIWYNNAIAKQCPSLVMGEGLEAVKLTVGRDALMEMLSLGKVFYTPCLQEPLFRYCVTIVPILENGSFAGGLVTASEASPAVSSSNNISGTEQLSAVFSQQIREPLFSVFSTLQLLNASAEQLAENTEQQAKLQEGIQQINQQCYHLLRFSMNFAELIRLENGAGNSESQRVELCGFLERLCTALHLTALDKGIDFFFSLPPKPLYLICDTNRLTYAILLLMANSFRFTAQGSIRLQVSAAQNNIHVTVSDSGCGIPAENLSLIYDLCFSYDPVQKCAAGPGIGLTLLRQMILSSGGTLLITSAGLGKGTTAAFDFPYENDFSIPLLHQDPVQGHFNDRFSLFHILMSGVAGAPEI